MSFKTFTILGERCSGTHFLQYSILDNFEIRYLNLNKHFFGHSSNPEMIYIYAYLDTQSTGLIVFLKDYTMYHLKIQKILNHF
jgi:hypothetical protein